MLTIEENKIWEALFFATDQDPTMPTFPITRTRKLDLSDFTNVWVKDESTNPTGTHKDRMAWSVVMAYRDILENKRRTGYPSELPSCSLISAGSAALAVQTQFRKYGLPNLRILVDSSTSDHLLAYLEQIGCDVYAANLGERPLSPEDILDLTDNEGGFDLTSNRFFDLGYDFYDWLSYEVFNEDPDYVIVPFGTGQLYDNLINHAKFLVDGAHPQEYVGTRSKVSQVHILGATTNDPQSQAVKLYAPFRPFTSLSNKAIELLATRGYIGHKSRVYDVREDFLLQANGDLNASGVPSEISGSAGLGLLYQLTEELPKDAKILVISTGKAKFPPAC